MKDVQCSECRKLVGHNRQFTCGADCSAKREARLTAARQKAARLDATAGRACSECGADISGGRLNQLTCGPVCKRKRNQRTRKLVRRVKPRVDGECSECNASLAGTRPNQLTCGDDCRKARAARLWREARGLPNRSCVICGERIPVGSLNRVLCGAADCVAARRIERRQDRPEQRVKPVASEAGTNWPVVIRRIERSSGPRSAALFVESLNSIRRRQGLPEVRL